MCHTTDLSHQRDASELRKPNPHVQQERTPEQRRNPSPFLCHQKLHVHVINNLLGEKNEKDT